MKKTKMKRKKWIRAVVALGLSLALIGCGTSGTQPDRNAGEGHSGQKGTIRIGYVPWAEDIAVTNLWKAILEEKGYTVELKQSDAGPLFAGLANGQLDLFLDAWLPTTHRAYWDKYRNKLEDYGVWYRGDAKIGLAVPEYVQNVNSIADLEGHKADFQGIITGIDAGAGEMKTVQEKVIPQYGLTLKLQASSEAAMLSALDKAYKEQKPIVITAWSPHWMFTKWKLKYLNDPKGAMGGSEQLYVLASKEFQNQHGEVAHWLKKFHMTDQQLGTLESYIADQGLEPLAAAKKWIGEHRDVVNQWLEE
ncbi:MAG: glycine betaine ABC transporter substrate-binding protein [Alicyclobacillaceae bacterium]|nr:glycine betaine ABC transporter substrate-binding protein [Alicyclobacillaceae bacterium]